MDYSKRLNELIELCQDTWVTLQQREQQHERTLSTGLVHQATHDLHLGIKKLVQLQNQVDEKPAVVKDTTWTEETERVMEDVRRQLQHATACKFYYWGVCVCGCVGHSPLEGFLLFEEC